MKSITNKVLIGAATACALMTTAQAGGIERGGYSIDLLFDPSRFAGEAAATYLMPQRKLKNVVDTDPMNGTPEGPDFADETESYFVPRVGFKAGIGESVDCMADYSQPWGAHTNPGVGWAGANSNVETKIDSNNYAATCSYRFDAGKGYLRAIGGVFYQEVGGFQEKLVAVIPGYLGSGIGRLDLEGEGWGWRAGAAYEIPEIAFRASLVYNSAVDLGDVTGTLDLTQVSGLVNPDNPLLGRSTSVFGTAAMPASAEFKLQSGIAAGWLAFGSVKWVDWSEMQSIPFCPESTRGMSCTTAGATKAVSLDLLYRDGWTVTAGVGREINEQWSAAASLSWDRGTSTGLGTQTDTWFATAGASFTPRENVEFRFGGALGVMTAGSSGTVVGSDGLTYGEEASYDFGNDVVNAITASLKVKF